MPIGSTLNGLKTLPRENISPTTKIVRKAATEEDKEQVRDMWKNGSPASEISANTGFAVATIYKWCKDIPRQEKQENSHVDEETKLQAKELYENGMAVARISEEIGVSKRSIFTWRNKYDWDKDKEKKEMVEQETIIEKQNQEKEATQAYTSPYKMIKADDVEKCKHLIERVLDLINLEISALDPWGAYSIGKSQCYLESIKEILSKED